MSAPAFPKSVYAREIFSVLFGGNTEVKECPFPESCRTPAAVGHYVDADGVPRCLILCDYEFANSAGAGLSLVLPAIVQQAVRKKLVDENLVDNLKEVLNICTNLFPCAEEHELRLDRVEIAPQGTVPPHEFPQAYEVQIPRYPVGKICLVQLS